MNSCNNRNQQNVKTTPTTQNINLDRFLTGLRTFNLSKSGFAKQLVLGTSSGWLTGFLAIKAGKVLAFAAGSGIILHQVAFNRGFTKTSLHDLRITAERKRADLEAKYANQALHTICKVRNFTKRNPVFAASFVGGCLIGMSF